MVEFKNSADRLQESSERGVKQLAEWVREFEQLKAEIADLNGVVYQVLDTYVQAAEQNPDNLLNVSEGNYKGDACRVRRYGNDSFKIIIDGNDNSVNAISPGYPGYELIVDKDGFPKLTIISDRRMNNNPMKKLLIIKDIFGAVMS